MVSTGLLHRARGFTLIEMAIVLVVIGLLLSGGLLGLAPVLESTRRTDTNSKMDRIEDALTLYVIQYGCLPCPADGDFANTAATAGRSLDDIGGDYTTQCTPNTGCRALGGDDVVPWATLGLTEADIIDGWGNRMRYSTDDNLVDTETDMVRSGSGFPAGTLDVNGTAGNAITTAAAYVLLSFGPDGSLARAAQTGATRADKFTSANQIENSDGDDDFVQDEIIDLDGNTYFGSGSCGNP
jgi:prepilin-type N-terminal cleavage/methylation domain-containing protein